MYGLGYMADTTAQQQLMPFDIDQLIKLCQRKSRYITSMLHWMLKTGINSHAVADAIPREAAKNRVYITSSTTPIATYKEGDNVLYLARVDGTKFKYGCSKNVGRRFDAHKRPGVYPTFEPIGILPCTNAVASEDKVRAYVKKNKLGAEYGTQREVVVLESVDALQRMMKKMYKFCLQQHVTTQPANEGADVVLRRIDADASIKMKKIEADVDMKKIEADVDMKKIEEAITKTKAGVDIKKIEAGMENTKIETMRMQMLINKIITVEQYLQIKNT
jgi:hypothetical protein